MDTPLKGTVLRGVYRSHWVADLSPQYLGPRRPAKSSFLPIEKTSSKKIKLVALPNGMIKFFEKCKSLDATWLHSMLLYKQHRKHTVKCWYLTYLCCDTNEFLPWTCSFVSSGLYFVSFLVACFCFTMELINVYR